MDALRKSAHPRPGDYRDTGHPKGPHPAFVWAVTLIKKAAARTHKDTGRLEARLADAIEQHLDMEMVPRLIG